MEGPPKGLLTEEQQNLLVQVINSESEPIPIKSSYLQQLASVLSTKVTVSATPKASDLISNASNLTSVIPTGFILLHNDLEALLASGSSDKAKAGGGESSGGLLSLLKPMLVGAGAAVVAAGLVKGLFGGVSDRTTTHVQELVDGLNERLTVDDLANDQTVLTAQKIGFIAYMEAYFLQQAASMGVSGVLEAVGEGAGKAVRGFFTSLFGKETESDATSEKLKTIVEAIIQAQTADMYIGDKAVSIAVKIGIIAYLTTYFATQTTAMAADTLLSGLTSAAGGAVNSFFTNLFGMGGSKSYDKIQAIVDDIINTQTSDNYIGDAQVEEAVKKGVIGYLEVYFKTQALSMATDSLITSLSGSAAGAVKSFLGTLFGKAQEQPDGVTKLKSIADTLMNELDISEVITWDEVQEAKKQGIRNYIVTYFEALADQSAKPEAKQSVAEKALNAVAGFLGKLFGKEDASEQAQVEGISKIIDALLSDINADTLSQDPEIQDAKKQGIKNYITSYFTAMGGVIAEKSESAAKEAYDAYAKEPLLGSNSLRGDGKTPKEFFAEIAKLTYTLDSEDLPDASELSAIKKQSVLDTAKALLNAEVSSFTKNVDFDKGDITYSIQSGTSINVNSEGPVSEAMLSTLNTISATLTKLSTVIDAIRENGPSLAVINTEGGNGVDTFVDIPS